MGPAALAQRGQASVELLGVLPLLLALGLAAIQLLAVGYASVLAGNAAEASRGRSRKDGRARHCKACVRRWQQENAEHLADYHRRWQQENQEKKRAQDRRYRERKREDPDYRERRRVQGRRMWSDTPRTPASVSEGEPTTAAIASEGEPECPARRAKQNDR